EIGGQFNIAKQVPGKEEFYETLRYFGRQIELAGVKLKLNHRATAGELAATGYAHIVLATGVTPRLPAIEGIDHPKVCGYLDVLRDKRPVGDTVALIGAGGIGFDVAEFLLQQGASASLDQARFFAEWGVDTGYEGRGGLQAPVIEKSSRKIFLLQRKARKVGDGLGKTTGWIHRTSLKNREVEMLSGVTYRRIDDDGLHISVGEREMLIPADTVVVCAGQEPQRELQQALLAAGCSVHLIGGADVAAELDAKRAIKQGTELAVAL
ncbi:MAG: FAD-dependent oxidoreductase, partial [Rhodoferax sp.]